MLISFFFAMFLSATDYTDDWFDSIRNRTIPVRIFLPEVQELTLKQGGKSDSKSESELKSESEKMLFPVVLLSHGLGGNRDGFGYLGEAWSKRGYLVVVMQHPGSDSATSVDGRRSGETRLQALARAANIREAQHRADDVSFVLDELEKRNQNDPRLAGKMDLNRIGLGGHSFGSQTTFAAIGRLPYQRDLRIKAAIVMSPNTPKNVDPILVHKNIKTPLLHLTGTRDASPISKDFKPEERRISFDSITGTDQYLVIFTDGNHMLFSGHPRIFGLSEMEKKCQPVIAELTRLFLDAYLKEDLETKKLIHDKFSKLMYGLGTVEEKKE